VDQQSGYGRGPSATFDEAPRKIRLLIADDHVTVVAGLSSIINMQPDMEVVGDARDGREAVEMWRRHRPDVILLDLRMPHLDGIGVLDVLRQFDPALRSIVLTTFDSEIEVLRAFRAGARAYLLKDLRREDLLDCIRKVYAGETCIPQDLMKKLADGISSETMTSRELAVLALLARGKSNKGIAEALLLSEITVKGHLRSIFEKLHVESRAEAISEASRRGLIRF
jgi:DNA-binding NarL/FixJ family response regulator